MTLTQRTEIYWLIGEITSNYNMFDLIPYLTALIVPSFQMCLVLDHLFIAYDNVLHQIYTIQGVRESEHKIKKFDSPIQIEALWNSDKNYIFSGLDGQCLRITGVDFTIYYGLDRSKSGLYIDQIEYNAKYVSIQQAVFTYKSDTYHKFLEYVNMDDNFTMNHLYTRDNSLYNARKDGLSLRKICDYLMLTYDEYNTYTMSVISSRLVLQKYSTMTTLKVTQTMDLLNTLYI